MIHVDFSEGKAELKTVGDGGSLLKEIALVVFKLTFYVKSSEKQEVKIKKILEQVAIEAASLEKIFIEGKEKLCRDLHKG